MQLVATGFFGGLTLMIVYGLIWKEYTLSTLPRHIKTVRAVAAAVVMTALVMLVFSL